MVVFTAHWGVVGVITFGWGGVIAFGLVGLEMRGSDIILVILEFSPKGDRTEIEVSSPLFALASAPNSEPSLTTEASVWIDARLPRSGINPA